jgi:hypothetical protein
VTAGCKMAAGGRNDVTEDVRVLTRELASLHLSASYWGQYAYVPVSLEGTQLYVQYLLIISKR